MMRVAIVPNPTAHPLTTNMLVKVCGSNLIAKTVFFYMRTSLADVVPLTAAELIIRQSEIATARNCVSLDRRHGPGNCLLPRKRPARVHP